MARFDDPVEAARRRQATMLRGSSYFPAANLRQFEGTELSPPGGGTYYNPNRYAGASPSLQRRAARNLAQAWQSDLAFNIQANPNIARSLESERIGAQFSGGGSFAGRPGYTTVHLPSGGTAVVPTSVAQKVSPRVGGNVGGDRPSPSDAYQLGFSGTLPASSTSFGSSYAQGFTGGREGAGVTQPTTGFGYQIGQGIAQLGTLGYNAIAGLFGRRPTLADDRTDLLRDTEDTFYGGGHAVPSPTPSPSPVSRLAYEQPRRYFD